MYIDDDDELVCSTAEEAVLARFAGKAQVRAGTWMAPEKGQWIVFKRQCGEDVSWEVGQISTHHRDMQIHTLHGVAGVCKNFVVHYPCEDASVAQALVQTSWIKGGVGRVGSWCRVVRAHEG